MKSELRYICTIVNILLMIAVAIAIGLPGTVLDHTMTPFGSDVVQCGLENH